MLAYDFLATMGIPCRNRPQDVVQGDLKAILRILYSLYIKFKKTGDGSESDSLSSA